MGHKKRSWCVWVGLLGGALLAGCDDGPVPASADYSVTVDGTLDGGVVTFVDVGAATGQGGGVNGVLSYAEVYVTSKAPACGWLDDTNATRADLVTLAFLVSNNGGATPAPITPGVYSVGSMYDQDAGINQVVQASLLVSDATCQGNADQYATSGSVTFTSLSSTAIVGSFNVTFQSGSTLTGSFNAPICATHLAEPADGGVQQGDAGACHP